MNSKTVKYIVVAMIAIVFGLLFFYFGDAITLDNLASKEAQLREFQRENPILVYVLAFLIYVLVTGLSLPGAAVLSLVYAWYFGFWRGLILISFASTSGATVAFLLSRYLLQESIQKRFGHRLKSFNESLEKEGAFYLFTLRLIPAVPFFVINVVMGLTRVRVWTFWWVSQVGMLAGTCIYVYAGSSIPSLAQLADPSLIRANDVSWQEFSKELVKSQDGGDISELATQMQSLEMLGQFNDDSRETLNAIANNPDFELDGEELESVVADMNSMVKSPHLALSDAWSSKFEESKTNTISPSDKKFITSINRQLLVKTYPDLIQPPKPIIGTNLILAFVLLAFFPIVVKKILGRFRKTDNEPAATDESDVGNAQEPDPV